MEKGAMNSYKKLFNPGYIGKIKLKNRLIRAAMWTTYGALDGSVTDRIIRHYRELASGGAGLVIVEYSHVDKKSSKSLYGQLSIAGDEYISGLGWLAMTIKQSGAQAGIQISHAGAQTVFANLPKKVPSQAPWQAILGGGQPLPEELNLEEIEGIIEAFGDAALRARKAGFGLVEVHASHGYLLTEFLSPATNRRTDRYGGSYENRMRILIEIVQNIRKKVGTDYPLSVRLDGSDYLEAGITIQESIETAKVLENSGVNAIHVSGGTHRNMDKTVIPMYWPRGYHVWAAEEIRRKVKIPVIASGSVTTPELAEKILEEEKADFVSLARPLVADPFFPKKAEKGRSEDIAPCIRCNVGCLERPEGTLTCTVNVAVGREDEFKSTRDVKRKKVAVIGGGPGGMEAARVAAMMGHEVILFEKRRMGGMLIEASVPQFKSDLQFLIDYLSAQIKKLNVEVISEEANVETIKNRGVEVVIISAGATPIVPDVPGVEKPITISALDVLKGVDVGKEVLVVGGGLVGSEIALFLAEKNKNVTIVEMLDQILPGVHAATSRQAFFERLNKHRVRIVTNAKLDEITNDGIITRNQDGTRTKLLGNTVVLALGLKTDSKLYDKLTSLTDIDVYTIGDYAEPRKIYHAIHEGHFVARNL